jgi:hypothetical protein
VACTKTNNNTTLAMAGGPTATMQAEGADVSGVVVWMKRQRVP